MAIAHPPRGSLGPHYYKHNLGRFCEARGPRICAGEALFCAGHAHPRGPRLICMYLERYHDVDISCSFALRQENRP